MLIKKRTQIILLAMACLITAKASVYAQISTAKPWTFWWWMGNAVNDKDIKHSLENFKRVGIGGVHIIPIYGVKGYESQFEPFLGDKFMHSVAYTVAEAKKLGLGVDMTTGTGWPFGGPNISEAQSAKKWIYKDGAFQSVSTMQKVKRSAPGGAGFVADPFDKEVMKHYLVRFDSAFAGKNIPLRSAYNDSYEVYGANWTNNFLQEFKKRRGYDISTVPRLLTDSADDLQTKLVKIDYQQTLSDLLYDNYQVWTTWASQRHLITRYQAHGSPGNILDLYSLATIPETEAFGSSNFKIPLLRVDEDYPAERSGRPNPLMMKFASSEAGVAGKHLISSETCTWLANHFKVSLSQCKPQIDELFAAGINHIFYHGTTYSPEAEKYPGWLFYASVNFGHTSHFYEEFHLLNQYVYNCQTILQTTKPDNDILIYFPVQEIWADQKTNGTYIHQLDVHHSDNWFLAHPMGKICHELTEEGFSFDYISDKQLEGVKTLNGKLQTKGGSYKVIVIPACAYLPPATLERLKQLGKQGATVIFDQAMPQHPMGYANFKEHSVAFEQTKNSMKADQVHFPVTGNLAHELVKHNVVKEMITGQGLSFIRKTRNGKTIYFITNLGNKFSGGWVSLSKNQPGLLMEYDPLTGKKSGLDKRTGKKGQEIYLSLLPGQSCFIMESATALPVLNTPKAYEAFKVNTGWYLQFMGGRPDYHKGFKLDSLQSWTSLSDTAAMYTGKAKYTGSINIPANVAGKKYLMLDLGTVNETAAVKINGKDIGTAWSIPFRIAIPKKVLVAGNNTFEIVVTNLSSNYMKVYDKQHPEWKKFYDVNIVDITYQPFDTSRWPVMPSGLSTNNMRILYR